MTMVLHLCGREGRAQRPDQGPSGPSLESLHHHLNDMDDGRKMLYAQMALIVRCSSHSSLASW